jgi:phosphopantetheinyl transferase
MLYYLNLSILSNNPNNLPKIERTQQLSAEARRILSQFEGRPLTNEDIARETSGRPFFPNRDMDFSISHSGALAAVSLVTGGGKNLRTGCDVELVRPRAGAGKIAREFFTAPERDYIENGGSFDLTRFYQIWTLKECFLKLRGLSVFDMPAAPSFIISKNQPRSTRRNTEFGLRETPCNSVVNFHLYELTGNADERYILATALAGTEAEQPEIRWFSQPLGDCHLYERFCFHS